MFLTRKTLDNPDYTKRNANELAEFTTKSMKEKHLSMEDRVYALLNDRAKNASHSLRLFEYEVDDIILANLTSDGFIVKSHKADNVQIHDIFW